MGQIFYVELNIFLELIENSSQQSSCKTSKFKTNQNSLFENKKSYTFKKESLLLNKYKNIGVLISKQRSSIQNSRMLYVVHQTSKV